MAGGSVASGVICIPRKTRWEPFCCAEICGNLIREWGIFEKSASIFFFLFPITVSAVLIYYFYFFFRALMYKMVNRVFPEFRVMGFPAFHLRAKKKCRAFDLVMTFIFGFGNRNKWVKCLFNCIYWFVVDCAVGYWELWADLAAKGGGGCEYKNSKKWKSRRNF